MKKEGLLILAIAATVITAGCGGGSVEWLGRGSKLDRPEETEIAPENTKVEDVEDAAKTNDDVILPSGPSTPTSEYTPPSVSPPAPSAEPVVPFSLQINAEKKTETRLGLVKLSWTATGAIEELYLWSEGFNRFPADKTDDDPCGPIADASMGATRHLFVNGIDGPNLGYDLNDGSPAHTAVLPYLDSAQHCDASLCEGFTGSENVPACRTDLDPSKPAVFYTRALTKDAVYHLCAKTAEGTTCADSDVIAAPQVSFNDVAAVLSPEGKVRFTLNYTYAIRQVTAPNGCADVNTSYDDRDHGRGSLVADCPLTMPAVRLRKTTAQETSGSELALHRNTVTQFSFGGPSFAAAGIGNGNVAQRHYHVDQGNPVVSVKHIGEVTCTDGGILTSDCKGRVDLLAEAYRKFTVLELKPSNEEVVLDGNVGVGPIKIYSNQGQVSGTSSEQKSPTQVQFNGVPRNHSHYQWRAAVELNGTSFKSPWWKEPRFPAKFELLEATQTLALSNWDTCEYEDVDDDEAECGACAETAGSYEASVVWKGRHLKNIGVYCISKNEGVISATNPVTIPNSYEEQGTHFGGPALTFSVPVNRSNWTDELTCVLTGEAYDGTKILRIQNWTPNCAFTHAVAHPYCGGAFVENGAGWDNQSDINNAIALQWVGNEDCDD